MNQQNFFDKKRQSKQQESIDHEQIEKTLNFFDSILNQYLTDQETIDENKIEKKSTQDTSIQQNSTQFNHTTSSSSSPPSSHYIRAPQLHHHSEQIPHVRHYTSENNLNKIPSSTPSKPKHSHSRRLRTTATSTEDLSRIPSKKLLSNLNKIADQFGASASLIDLSSIDKLSSRPRFRFVPSSNENNILTEEPEIEQQFHMKTIPSDETSFNNQTKSSHKIVKPIVIIPTIPKSAPISRLTETNIHHQNENSAFKPHRSNKTEQTKRTESNVHVGMTNPNNKLSDHGLLSRHQQSIPQYHQSMLNLSSPELINTNPSGSRTSYQSNNLNGYYSARPVILENPVSKRIQQINHTNSLNGLLHPGDNRSQQQQQTYPYGSQMSTNTGISSGVNNSRQQTYFKPINIHKHHSSYQTIPAQSLYFASPAVIRNDLFPSSSSNVYNFNQNNSPREGQSRRNPHRQNVRITTYL